MIIDGLIYCPLWFSLNHFICVIRPQPINSFLSDYSWLSIHAMLFDEMLDYPIKGDEWTEKFPTCFWWDDIFTSPCRDLLDDVIKWTEITGTENILLISGNTKQLSVICILYSGMALFFGQNYFYSIFINFCCFTPLHIVLHCYRPILVVLYCYEMSCM